MAVKLAQTERTKNSVTFSVNGITTDRRTLIWVQTLEEWVVLSNATVADGVTGIDTDGVNNGTITVYFDSAAINSGYKVWAFKVQDYDIANKKVISESEILYSVLLFGYENTEEKEIGSPIDITVKDFKNISKFAWWIYKYLGTTDSDIDEYYIYDGVVSGDVIYAEDLLRPAQHIRNAISNLTISAVPLKGKIIEYTEDIIDNVRSGADFKAKYFNEIWLAINQFNMNV